jgi:hypothetical protein
VGGIMGVDLQGHDLSAQSTIYFSTSTDNSWSDPSVISAHYNAAITYNYYRTVFGRNSIDDKGMTIYSIVHVTESGQPMDNAFWSSTVMCYGDGNTLFKPLAGGFDVAAHEMTHGVTQHSANLIYKDQSGALNESMSDVFASAVDSANWTIGEQVIKDFGTFPSGALRSMSDPHQQRHSQPGLLSDCSDRREGESISYLVPCAHELPDQQRAVRRCPDRNGNFCERPLRRRVGRTDGRAERMGCRWRFVGNRHPAADGPATPGDRLGARGEHRWCGSELDLYGQAGLAGQRGRFRSSVGDLRGESPGGV